MYNIARNRNMEGLFIVIDGPSASGKDSIIKEVLEVLGRRDIKAVSIEETKDKNYNRKNILQAKKIGDKEAAKAILSERKKIYKEKVIPQVSNGIIVIANRGEPSTLSYQTIRKEITMEDVWDMHRSLNIPIPDLVVITNCSVDEAIRRENLRKFSFEEKDRNFLSGKFSQSDFAKRKDIHTNYENVGKFLKKKGLNVIYLNTDTIDIHKAGRKIVSFIEKQRQLV